MTPRRLDILRLIEAGCTAGCAPSLQEIANKLRRAKVTVHEQVQWLVAKGYLARTAEHTRNLSLTQRGLEALHPPVDPDPLRRELQDLQSTAPNTKYGQRVRAVFVRLLATPAK